MHYLHMGSVYYCNQANGCNGQYVSMSYSTEEPRYVSYFRTVVILMGKSQCPGVLCLLAWERRAHQYVRYPAQA